MKYFSASTLLISFGFCVTSLLSYGQQFDLDASIARGEGIYAIQCATCHQTEGEGLEGVYPPLAKSDYLMENKSRSIDQILHGITGEITVNGKTYNIDMPAVELTDIEVSDVLNYVRNSWGNKGEPVTPEEVKTARK